MRRRSHQPANVKSDRLSDGRPAWFWQQPPYARGKDCPVHAEPLGNDLVRAFARAELLNEHLRAWRIARRIGQRGEPMPPTGTLHWLFTRYYQTRHFEHGVSKRAQGDYRKALNSVVELRTKSGGRIGDLPLSHVTVPLADKIYDKFLIGPDGKRYRTANLNMDLARRAWNVVRGYHPDIVPELNPFKGVHRERHVEQTKHATPEQVRALADALRDMGHAALGVTALVCFYWAQRPENVLAGHLCWSDYRGADAPHHANVFHHKTNARVLRPLGDAGGLFYPLLEARIAELPRLGTPIVLNANERGPDRRYSFSYARALVRKARIAAGLPAHVTLAACRHGGVTALRDMGATKGRRSHTAGTRRLPLRRPTPRSQNSSCSRLAAGSAGTDWERIVGMNCKTLSERHQSFPPRSLQKGRKNRDFKAA